MKDELGECSGITTTTTTVLISGAAHNGLIHNNNDADSSILFNESEFPSYPEPIGGRRLNWTFVDSKSGNTSSCSTNTVHQISVSFHFVKMFW